MTNPSWQHETWRVTKPARTSRGGLVACQHRLAAMAGVELLRSGGNAVDAAAAAAFAMGVVEPWMSGIGGVGFMVAADAKTGKVSFVDFGPVAPGGPRSSALSARRRQCRGLDLRLARGRGGAERSRL